MPHGREYNSTVFPAQGPVMANQKLQSELTRLRKQQAKARQDEIFGGFSRAERAEYDARANRIHDVETELELHTEPTGSAALVLSLVNHAHATTTELLHDAVVRYGLADH